MATQDQLREALEHMEHVVAQRAKNEPTHHLDIRLCGPSLSIVLLEVSDLRDLINRALAH